MIMLPNLIRGPFTDPAATLKPSFFGQESGPICPASRQHGNTMKESLDDENKYDQIEQWCLAQIQGASDIFFDPSLFRSTLRAKSMEWSFPYESLHSFLRNLHLYHVKVMTRHIQRNSNAYVKEYVKDGVSILTLAKRENYPPYLLSRYLVEQMTVLPDGKKGLTRSMRDPRLVLGDRDIILPEYQESELHPFDSSSNNSTGATSTTRLAMEVERALSSDPLYGPKHDRQRNTIGLEYEVVLEDMLRAMDIPFENESQLRDKGSARTPDIVLQVPIGVKVGSEWRVVCWIDSKALFGDVGTHKTTVLPQAVSYVHRFGPGMILYWFGHAPLSRLGDANGDLVIQGWEMPHQYMWPTGEIGNRPPDT